MAYSDKKLNSKKQKENMFKTQIIEFVLSPKRVVFSLLSLIVFTGFLTLRFEIVKVLAAPGINQTVNFQGKVVNADGTNVADGEYSFTFTLYDASSGGSTLWTETQGTVQVTAGIFRVSLGSVASLSSVNFNSDNIYLGINFNSDGEMTPRIRFASVPYAFNAQKVAGLTVTNTTGTLTIPDSTTVQFGGSFTTSAQDLTLTLSGATNVTLPTTGTLSTLAGSEVLTNKTIGSTGLVFSGASTDITTGSNEDFVIAADGTGKVLIQAQSGGDSAFIVDKTGNGDIFSASSSGATRFAIDNSGNLILANNESIRNTTDGTITLARNDAGTVTLTAADNDAVAALTILSGGASALTIDTGGAAVLGLGTANATSAVLGSASLTSFTVTTTGTGDTAVVLPSQSVSSSEILDNTLDFTDFSSSMTLDASTTVSLSTLDYIFDLTSTGEFYIRDAGNTFAYFGADGTITFGKTASGGTINLGVGTGADVINIGSDNTSGDTLVIGNDNASTTLSLTGGNDWSITSVGASTFTELHGAGLSDCDASTSKLLWNDATGTFSCGTDLGSNLQVVSFTDTTTEVATFTSAMDIWDGTYPNITPANTSSSILVSVNIRGTSDDAADHNPVFTIRRAIGSNPTCSSTQVGGEFVGGFLTTASQNWGAAVTFSDAPSSTGNVRYTVCTTTTGLDDANTDDVRVVLTEIGSSSAGGGGNVSVRESDGSPSVASASTIEFGPATTSSDQFIVTDEGSGIARIILGDQVGMLNEAETVTGGWTFNTGNTTFTTSIIANGGLTTTSNNNIALTPNGTGDIILNTDHDTGFFVGSASNTPSVLSVVGGFGGNAAFVLDQLNNGDILAASSSGVTRFVVDNSGNVEIAGSIGLSTGNIDFSSTGGIVFNGGTISDVLDEVDIDDDLAVNGNITLTGTTGLTLSGTGADIIFANNEAIRNDTDGTFTLARNDAGTVTIVSADNDATAALSILSGGAEALTLDTGGAAVLGIGTTNSTAINIGNTSSATTLSLTKGASGNIVFTGFNCTTYTNGGVLTTDSSGNIECQNDDGGAATATYWDSSEGALYPNNTTYDVFFGGISTESAKFGFLNLSNGGIPTATISATNGNALSLSANGAISTTQNQDLTLGGGDSGDVYVASALHIDETLGLFGGGLSDCDNPSTSKLLWDFSTNRFSCGTDQGGGGGSSITVRESDSSPAVSAVAVLEFGPVSTSTDEFIVSDEGSNIARVRIGTQVGMLNEAETVTGGWTFDTGTTTFTTAVNLNGGLTTSATDQNLAFSANGAGDFVFNIDSGTNVQLTGGADGTDAFVISAGDILLSDGDFDLSGGDFNVVLDAGDTANITKTGANAGDIFAVTASSVNSIDGIQIDLTSTSDSGADNYNGFNFTWTESTDADIVNAINIGNTTSTNSTTTAINIGTGWDTGILVQSGGITVAGGGLTISSGGVAVNSGDITSTQSTLTIDAAGTVSIADNLTVTGTTGITISGAGADLIFANNESIRNDTDGIFTLARNDAGIVTLTSADNDAAAALTITSGGASTLTLDTGGAAALGIGATSNAITVGNTTNGTALTLNSGTGGINIGDSATTKTIEIGGADSDGADTIRIATNATSADTITIGNSNSTTTMSLTGGDDWSITTAGAATFATFSGSGLTTCNGSTQKLLWNGGSFSCGTDQNGSDLQMASATLGETTLGNTATFINTVSVTPSTATGDVYVQANIWTKSASNTDQTITLQIRTGSGSTCAGSLLASGTALLISSNNQNGPNVTASYLAVDPGASSQTYAICALSDSASGATAGGLATALVIDTGADLAEFYTTADSSIEAGDIVSGDALLSTGVKKSTRAYEDNLFGIISTYPALAIGNVTKEGVGGVPVALSGRVPVKVTTENGPIKAGDYLTSSSIPGVAMKATKAGPVVGIAMHDYDSQSGMVLTFVKTGYFTGSTLLDDSILDASHVSSSELLDNFINNPQVQLNSSDLSEVVTDRVVAGLEIISPKIVAKAIELEKIAARKGLVEVELGENGSLVISGEKGDTAISFDNSGNANFKGTITADKVVANQIQGLEFIVSDLIATDSAKLSIDKSLLDINSKQGDLTSQMASISARLDSMGAVNLLGLNSNDDDLEVVTVNNFASFGTTTLSEVSVLNSLVIGSGNSLSISDNAINVIGTDLAMQPLKQGAVSFLGGSIRFETDGKAVFAEDVLFEKNVAVAGVLSAKSVSATDLLLGKGQTIIVSDDEVDATSAAGLVTLKKEKLKIRINNPLVKENSYIFITPKTSTSRTLFLLNQIEAKDDEKAYFEVGVDRENDEDIKFNYLIVN